MGRWFLLFLAACYAPKVQPNVPCSEDLHCPDGQRCELVAGVSLCISGDALPDAPVAPVDAMSDAPLFDAMIDGDLPKDAMVDAAVTPDAKLDAMVTPDAMVDAMADAMVTPDAMVDAMADAAVTPDASIDAGPVDTDGDGVPDSVDNCPTVANADQANEDGDRFGDACDPCPPVADDNPPDTDGDGVADVCDPRPTTPGDKIVLFEGFHAGIPNTWQNNGGWTASAGNAVISLGGASGAATLTISQALVEPYTVSTDLTPTAFASFGGVGIGPVARVTGSGPPGGVECDALQSQNTLTILDLATQAHQGGQSMTFTPGTAYLMGVGKSADASVGYGCLLSNNGSFTAAFTPFGVLGNRVGIRATGISATVAWVMAIDASGP